MPNQGSEFYAEDVRVSYNSEQLELAEVASFNQSQKPACVKSVKWHSSGNTLLTVDNKILSTWNIGEGKISVSSTIYFQFSTSLFTPSAKYSGICNSKVML